MARLTRDSILKVLPRQLEIDVPEWGGSVLLQELTLRQQQDIAASTKGGNDTSIAVKTFLEGVVDPQFTAADAEALEQKGVAAFKRIVEAIGELSGMGQAQTRAIQSK